MSQKVLLRIRLQFRNDLEAIKIAFENYGDDIAGIIVEPVAGNMGVVPKDGFLQGLREITNDYGALLIFDENDRFPSRVQLCKVTLV